MRAASLAFPDHRRDRRAHVPATKEYRDRPALVILGNLAESGDRDPGRPFHEPGASLRDDVVVFALDLRPEDVKLLEPSAALPPKGARVRIVGVPWGIHQDQDHVYGSIASASDARRRSRVGSADVRWSLASTSAMARSIDSRAGPSSPRACCRRPSCERWMAKW